MPQDYKWYYGYGDGGPEQYYGGFATKEEAIEEGLDMAAGNYEKITIVEAIYAKLNTDIFDELVFERLANANEEAQNEDGEIGVESATNEMANELNLQLRAVLDAWLVKHNLDYCAWAFGDTRNEEIIDVPPLHDHIVSKTPID